MAHKYLNPLDPLSPKRIAIVISNPAISTTGWPVGFCWPEFTQPYLHFAEVGYEVVVVSPDRGECAADTMSGLDDATHWRGVQVHGVHGGRRPGAVWPSWRGRS